jgi:hypothetical protein
VSATVVLWVAFVVFAAAVIAIFVYSLRSLRQHEDVEERLLEMEDIVGEEESQG